MRQVPCYLVIGNGRVAKHFQHYLSLLNISFKTWHRQESIDQLQHQLKAVSHVLLLISDQAIIEFISKNLKNTSTVITHFSGSVVTSLAYGAHPLMTFSPHHLYSLEQYKSIPFILDENAPPFENLLPGIPNHHVRLHTSLKAKYHALCVLSGNFSCMLWQKLFSAFKEFNFPPEIAYPYLQQQTQNLLLNYQSAMTGPLVRQDRQVIEENIKALEKDPFQEVYKSFVTCYQEITGGV